MSYARKAKKNGDEAQTKKKEEERKRLIRNQFRFGDIILF